MNTDARPLRILFSGTRRGVGISAVALATMDWLDRQGLSVGTVWPPPIAVHGAASGVDSEADQVARNWGWKVEAHPADWKTHGAVAGLLRNRHMASLGANVLLAFPALVGESRGTRRMMKYAEDAGIPVVNCTALLVAAGVL